jgi:hypothetical protein
LIFDKAARSQTFVKSRQTGTERFPRRYSQKAYHWRAGLRANATTGTADAPAKTPKNSRRLMYAPNAQE